MPSSITSSLPLRKLVRVKIIVVDIVFIIDVGIRFGGALASAAHHGSEIIFTKAVLVARIVVALVLLNQRVAVGRYESSSNNGCHLYSADTSQCADTSTSVRGNAGFYDRACDVGLPVSNCDYKYNVLPTCVNTKNIATLAAPVSVQNCMAVCQSRGDCGSFFFWNESSSNNGCHLYFYLAMRR